jgi:Cof subfamily protein (haloacid dehalogenase superfamily)
MKYKIAALDVDGTLINDEYQLTPLTLKTLMDYQSRGGRIVLCTGRGPLNTLPILQELGVEGEMITYNGAATITSSALQILDQFSFSIGEALPFIRYCRKHAIHFDVCTPLEMYMERVSEIEKRMYEKYMLEPDLLQDIATIDQPLVKFTAFGGEAIMNQVEKDWKQLDHGLKVIRSGDFFIDVMNRKASKGNALKHLAELWEIDSSEIIAIGNYYNDLEMIRFAGLGIAMENSPEGVKQAANFVTASNNEEGVHKAFQKYI